MQAIPRIKFEFYVQFVLGPSAQQMLPPSAKLSNYGNERGISFKVKTVDKPKVTLQVDELNQYNKKVLVYKKVDYGDMTVRLHDTVDDSILATWVDYFTFYFADSRKKTGDDPNNATPAAPYEQSPYNPNMQWDSGWGFQPLVNNDTNFFTSIIVYVLYANTYTAWSYVNPKITAIDWQSLDYSSSEPEEVNVSFKYEAIRYLAFGVPINTNTTLGFMPDFGFTPADFINPPLTPPTPGPHASPRIFTSALSPVQNTTTQITTPSNNISNPSANTPTLTGVGPAQVSQAAQAAAQATANASASLSNPTTQVPLETAATTTLNQQVSFGGSYNF
jgi:hypothetical protein